MPAFRISLFFLVALVAVGLGFIFSAAVASVLGLLLMAFATRMLFRSPVGYVWGLPLSSRGVGSYLLALVCGAACFFVLQVLLRRADATLEWRWNDAVWATCVTVWFQSLLEEVLFRGLLLRQWLMRSKLSLWQVNVSLSAMFSLFHWLNYFAAERTFLDPTTLVTLFLLALAGNLMVVAQGHLYGAWGYHAGWNMLRYASLLTVSGQNVGEGESFNRIEGSVEGVGIALTLLIAVVILYFRHTRRNDVESPVLS